MTNERSHHYWISGLTAAWLIATFEHNYFTLSKYSHNIMMGNTNITTITNILLVIALDMSVFWAVKFIPQAKIWKISVRGAQSVLILSTLFSILLNIRYMITASPSQDFFDIMVAVVTGMIIPSYVAIFGWITGNISVRNIKKNEDNLSFDQELEMYATTQKPVAETKPEPKPKQNTDGEPVPTSIKTDTNDVDNDYIKNYINKNPDLSVREIADNLDIPQSKIKQVIGV